MFRIAFFDLKNGEIMKLYSLFCATVTAQFDFSNGFGTPVDDDGLLAKKVPPRTPPQRLETLGRFINEWLDDHMTTVASYDSWKQRVDENTARMEKAYNRKSCAYFNPDLPHGGPNPNPRQDRVTHAKTRRRRSLKMDLAEARRMSDNDAELFAPYEEIDQFGRSMGDLTRYDRENPLIAIRQITTGFRKWAERYIAECHGQRVYSYQKKRMNRWFKRLGEHYMKLNANQPDSGY